MNTEKKLIQFSAERVAACARATWQDLQGHHSIGPVLHNQWRTGGFLCYEEPDVGPLLVSQVGACLADNVVRFRTNAQEKTGRLALHPDHVLSRESRDEEKNRWSGAYRTTSGPLLGFSGAPEPVDEIYVLWLAVKLGLSSRAEALEVVMRFPNDFGDPGDNSLFR